MRRPTPLASFGVLRTTDVDEARASVSAQLAPHRLNALDAKEFRVTHNVVDLDRVSLHYIDYAAEVEVAVSQLNFMLVEVPLAGVTTISHDDSALIGTPDRAVVSGWGFAHRRHFSPGNPRLMVRIDPSLVRERTAVANRCGLVVPHQFGAEIDLRRDRGRTWRRLLDAMVGDIEQGHTLLRDRFVATSWETALVDGLVSCLAERSEQPRHAPIASAPVIAKAARLIDDHCAEVLGTPDIAEAVGVSVRSLQEGFRRHLDTTPMAYLRQARLQRVRESLMDGSAASVTDAATRWGFAHLGRLSVEYRESFGESPRDTLRRSR